MFIYVCTYIYVYIHIYTYVVDEKMAGQAMRPLEYVEFAWYIYIHKFESKIIQIYGFKFINSAASTNNFFSWDKLLHFAILKYLVIKMHCLCYSSLSGPRSWLRILSRVNNSVATWRAEIRAVDLSEIEYLIRIERLGAVTGAVGVWMLLSGANLREQEKQWIMLPQTMLIQAVLSPSYLVTPSFNIIPPCPGLFLSVWTKFLERDKFFNNLLTVVVTRKPVVCIKLASPPASLCIYIYLYAYIHVCMYIHKYTYMYVYIYLYIGRHGWRRHLLTLTLAYIDR